MSFILDQLRKSGKKRELELAMRARAGTDGGGRTGVTPVLVQDAAGARFHIRGVYLLLLLLLIVLFSALGGSLLLRGRPWRRQAPVENEAHLQSVAPSAPGSGIVSPKSPAPVERGTFLPSRSRSKADPKKAAPTTPVIARKMPDRRARVSIPPAASAPRNQPAPEGREPMAVAPPQERPGRQDDDAHRAPYLDELPDTLRRALPPIHITSHLYRGHSRLVSINGRIMSEGVSMDHGLFLEEITPEGVVLSFRGHRFRVRAD